MSASGTGSTWEGDLHKVSPYNFLPEIQEQYDFREPLVIQDWTPLKLDHLPASRLYSVEEYQEVARLLDAVGVQETVFLANQYGTAKGPAGLGGASGGRLVGAQDQDTGVGPVRHLAGRGV